VTRLQLTLDRVTTVFHKGCTRFLGPLTSCDGSDLLPLGLPWHCSWVDRFFHPPQSGGFANFATFAHSPNSPAAFALRWCSGALWRGGPARPARPCWLAVVTWTPLGHCVSPTGRNSPEDLTQLGVVSCDARLAAQFLTRSSRRVRSRPEELVKAAFRTLRCAGESVDQLHCPFPGCPGVSHGSYRSFFHYRGLGRASASSGTEVPSYSDLWINAGGFSNRQSLRP
jgi:hypothetical protein